MGEGRTDTGDPVMIENETVKLQNEKALLVEEIRSYPRPVAGCDAQFNYLLERRHAIERALIALRSSKSRQE
jgi:hypothetical protein